MRRIDVASVRFLSPRVEEAAPDITLHGRLYLPSGHPGRPHPGLVVGHGAGSCASRHADFCLVACETGFVVLALDFRGHGDSSGEGDGPLELDVLAAVHFLREHPTVDQRRVAYRGSSMGGFYGLKAAPQAGFAAMALLCPASARTMLRAIRRAEKKKATAPGADSARWDTPRLRMYFENETSHPLGREVRCPVLIVQARGDETVPLGETLTLARELQGETQLLLLPGGSHTSAQHDPRIHKLTAAWLWEKVKQREQPWTDPCPPT